MTTSTVSPNWFESHENASLISIENMDELEHGIQELVSKVIRNVTIECARHFENASKTLDSNSGDFYVQEKGDWQHRAVTRDDIFLGCDPEQSFESGDHLQTNSEPCTPSESKRKQKKDLNKSTSVLPDYQPSSSKAGNGRTDCSNSMSESSIESARARHYVRISPRRKDQSTPTSPRSTAHVEEGVAEISRLMQNAASFGFTRGQAQESVPSTSEIPSYIRLHDLPREEKLKQFSKDYYIFPIATIKDMTPFIRDTEQYSGRLPYQTTELTSVRDLIAAGVKTTEGEIDRKRNPKSTSPDVPKKPSGKQRKSRKEERRKQSKKVDGDAPKKAAAKSLDVFGVRDPRGEYAEMFMIPVHKYLTVLSEHMSTYKKDLHNFYNAQMENLETSNLNYLKEFLKKSSEYKSLCKDYDSLIVEMERMQARVRSLSAELEDGKMGKRRRRQAKKQRQRSLNCSAQTDDDNAAETSLTCEGTEQVGAK